MVMEKAVHVHTQLTTGVNVKVNCLFHVWGYGTQFPMMTHWRQSDVKRVRQTRNHGRHFNSIYLSHVVLRVNYSASIRSTLFKY